MSAHVFECQNSGYSDDTHVIFDISEEPVPHIGKVEKIWCPTCKVDVDGTYLGQAINFETNNLGSTVPKSELELYRENDNVYCLHCDGKCQK